MQGGATREAQEYSGCCSVALRVVAEAAASAKTYVDIYEHLCIIYIYILYVLFLYIYIYIYIYCYICIYIYIYIL
jgi:hypothetical protein